MSSVIALSRFSAVCLCVCGILCTFAANYNNQHRKCAKRNYLRAILLREMERQKEIYRLQEKNK